MFKHGAPRILIELKTTLDLFLWSNKKQKGYYIIYSSFSGDLENKVVTEILYFILTV